jgi:hypothetical protein
MATLQDALARALVDKTFAQEFSQDPEKFRSEYNLSDEDIETISEVGNSDVSGYLLRSPTMTTGTVAFTMNYYGFKL